jgi:hypothetical protein
MGVGEAGPRRVASVRQGWPQPATTAAAADIEVDDADEIERALRALRATGADGTSDPYDTPYGREVVHIDPDSNLLRFIGPALA